MDVEFDNKGTIYQNENKNLCDSGEVWCEDSDSYPAQLAQSALNKNLSNISLLSSLPQKHGHFPQQLHLQRKRRHSTRLFSSKGKQVFNNP